MANLPITVEMVGEGFWALIVDPVTDAIRYRVINDYNRPTMGYDSAKDLFIWLLQARATLSEMVVTLEALLKQWSEKEGALKEILLCLIPVRNLQRYVDWHVRHMGTPANCDHAAVEIHDQVDFYVSLLSRSLSQAQIYAGLDNRELIAIAGTTDRGGLFDPNVNHIDEVYAALAHASRRHNGRYRADDHLNTIAEEVRFSKLAHADIYCAKPKNRLLTGRKFFVDPTKGHSFYPAAHLYFNRQVVVTEEDPANAAQ